MLRWSVIPAFCISCATVAPTKEVAPGPVLPGTDSVCEQLTEASEEGPYAAFYVCRLEGQTCIVLQSYDAAGGLSLDCEDDEDG